MPTQWMCAICYMEIVNAYTMDVCHLLCGDTPQAYQRPFLGFSWGPPQIYVSGPFWALLNTKPNPS